MSVRWRETVLVASAYLACLAGATWPWPLNLAEELPALSGAVLHDLAEFEGRGPSGVLGRDGRPSSLWWPTGSGHGLDPSQPLARWTYRAARALGAAPVPAYNATWLISVLTIGLGTFLLARRVQGDRACAALAGAMVMLSAPVRMRVAGHLDVLGLGAVALALLAWLRWNERPGRGRAAAACFGMVAVAMAGLLHVALLAPILLAGAAAGWLRQLRGPKVPIGEARDRVVGGALIIGVLAISVARLHAAEIRALAGPAAPAGTRAEYASWSAPLWSYLLPATGSRLAPLLEFEPFRAAGIEGKVHEASSYLGIVTLVFLVRALRFPPAMEGRRLWWFALALFLVLSLGAWPGLRDAVPLVRWVRIPARWNLGVVLVAALIAAASMRDWLGGRRAPVLRWLAFAGLAGLVVADGSRFPLASRAVPAEPTLRRRAFAGLVADRSPEGRRAVLEVPLADGPDDVPGGLRAVWSLGRDDRTSAGTSALPNAEFDRRVGWPCPIRADRMQDPGFPREGPVEAFDLIRNADFDSYMWLYLRVHGFARMLATDSIAPDAPRHDLSRLRARLARAIVLDDPRGFVIDAGRLAEPTVPVVLLTTGWLGRQALPGASGRRVAAEAGLAAFDPEPDRGVRLAVEAASFRHARTVRATVEGRVVATWTVSAREPRLYVSPAFVLPPGLRTITLVSEGDEAPRGRPGDSDERFSLVVTALTLQRAEPEARTASVAATEGLR